MAPQILFALTARGSVVLSEHSIVSGNAHLVAHRILEKLSSDTTRVSYSQDQHLFHCLVANGVIFLCMADEALGRRIPFAFLEDIKDRFLSLYGAAVYTAPAYAFDGEFSKILKQQLDYFNHDPNADAINRVKGEISEVKTIMVENIEKVLERGERLELLVDKTDHLQNEAFAFKRQARQLKQRMWWRNIRSILIIIMIVLIIAYTIVCFVCSPTFKCHK